MRRLLVFAVVCLSAMANASVSVSGNLQDLTGTAVTSRTFVRFIIRGCAGNQARFTGTASLTPNYEDFIPDNTGAFSGTLYDSLTEISCGGSTGNTWYGVVIYRDGRPGPEVSYNVTGASFNLNSATPNTTLPVVAAPTGDSTYLRLDGGNNPTGSIVPSADNTKDLGGVAAAWRTGYFKTSIVFLGTTISTKTGSGAMVLGTSPSIATPTITSPTISTSISLPSASIADAALSSNAALYNNGTKTWCATASCTWNIDVGNGGGSFTLQPLNITSGTSGTAIIKGGAFSSGSGAGGALQLLGGFGGPGGGNGGGVAISGGSSQLGATNGGDITLTPGFGNGVGKNGGIVISGTSAPSLSGGSLSEIYYDTTKQRLQLSENGGAYSSLTSIPCVTSQKSESAADSNVLTCTPPAAVGSYRIRFTEDVSAQNTATLGWTATWTDSNAHAQAPTNLSLLKSGTAAPALTFVAATNDHYYGSIDIDVDSSGTAIVVKTTFTGTSFTSKVTASVERIN